MMETGNLSLYRKLGESIYIADDIVITVVNASRTGTTLRVSAPKHVPIHRWEHRRGIETICNYFARLNAFVLVLALLTLTAPCHAQDGQSTPIAGRWLMPMNWPVHREPHVNIPLGAMPTNTDVQYIRAYDQPDDCPTCTARIAALPPMTAEDRVALHAYAAAVSSAHGHQPALAQDAAAFAVLAQKRLTAVVCLVVLLSISLIVNSIQMIAWRPKAHV